MKVKPADRTALVQEYYFSRKLRQIDQMRQAGKDIINLGIGSPDQSPSEATISRLAATAAGKGVHGYQSYNGNPALRKAFAGWYNRYFGVTLNPENEVLVLMGSKEGIMHISMAFVNPGDEVLVPDPGYPTYSSVTNLVGGKVRYYDLDEENGWYPDLDSLEKTGLSNVRLMWINYPNMPTGAKANAGLFERVVSFAERNNILVCNDNPYSFILNNDYLSILGIPGAKEVCLELNSLSKSHNMAGWRVGMVAGNSEYISNILKVKSNMDSGMFLPVQMAAVEALSSPDSWYDGINAVYGERRKAAEAIMDLLGCISDPRQTGLFLWGRIPERVESCESFVDEILEEAEVFITPGFIFGSNGNRYLRISLCTDTGRLNEAAGRIGSFIKNK
jgi:LL-diaminopimelate aminotransferase